MKMNLDNCSLVKVSSRDKRLTFVFKHQDIKNSPMRTMEVKLGSKKKSLFEVYCLATLGFIPELDEYSPQEISELILEKAKGMNFTLVTQPSRCKRYTDILSIERGS
jgi:hypothetical protein